MKTLAFFSQICYNLGVEVTNFIAVFSAMCYGSSDASYAIPLVTSTLTAEHVGRFNSRSVSND